MQSCRRAQGLRGAVADAGAPLACRTTFERAGVGLQLWIRGDDVKNGRSRRSGGGVCEGLCGIEGALASTSDGGLAGLVVWLDGLVRMGRSVRKESASARTTAPVTAARCMGETRVDLAAGACR